jgi:dihydroxyacid dehydratase/phosphogluconate dehydratase
MNATKTSDVTQRNAFVYLTQNIDKSPESVVEFVKKAAEYIQQGTSLLTVIQNARNTIDQTNEEIIKLQGAVAVLLELSCDKLTPEQLIEFAALGAEIVKNDQAAAMAARSGDSK